MYLISTSLRETADILARLWYMCTDDVCRRQVIVKINGLLYLRIGNETTTGDWRLSSRSRSKLVYILEFSMLGQEQWRHQQLRVQACFRTVQYNVNVLNFALYCSLHYTTDPDYRNYSQKRKQKMLVGV